VQNPALTLVKLHAVGDCQPNKLRRPLCKASVPLSEPTALPNLVPSASLLTVRSSPASRSFIKTVKGTGLKMEPWGTPLVTGYQPNVTPFTTAL